MFRSRNLKSILSVTKGTFRSVSNLSHIQVLNSLTGSLQPLQIRDKSHIQVNIAEGQKKFIAQDCGSLTYYICGPTVYDVAHQGHARTYVSLDIILRVMTDFFNIPVYTAVGVTDIDDKIIARAKERGVDWLALAREFEASFFDDLVYLGVKVPSTKQRVTEHIDEIQAYIQSILDNGLAYVSEGSVYFDTKAFQDQKYTYGKLKLKDPYNTDNTDTSEYQGVDIDTGNTTISSTLHGKKHSNDFALWKASKDANEPGWASPWGVAGRPGWHIECSAMTAAALGSGIDIHAGGVDLKFPHHCNEIAQGEACFGYGLHEHVHSIKEADLQKEWCALWMHTGHLHIEGRKMSKSLKNFISIKELREQGFTADEFRMLCCLNHYRSTVDYSKDKIEQSKGMIRGILNIKELLNYTKQQLRSRNTKNHVEHKFSSIDKALKLEFMQIQELITSSLQQDFNIPHVIQQQNVLQSSISKRVKLGQVDNMEMVQMNLLEELYSYIQKIYDIQGFEFAREYNDDTIIGKEHGNAVSESQARDIASLRGRIKNTGQALKMKKSVSKEVERLLSVLEQGEPVSSAEVQLLREQQNVRNNAAVTLMEVSDEIREKALPAQGYTVKDLGGDEFFLRRLEAHETK